MRGYREVGFSSDDSLRVAGHRTVQADFCLWLDRGKSVAFAKELDVARPGKPADCAPMTYSMETLRGWLSKLSDVVEFDLDAHVECRPELCDGMSEDHNLNEDGEFWASYFPDDFDSAAVQPHHVRDFAEAYECGKLSDRSRLSLSCSTWFHVAPVSERAEGLVRVEEWDDEKLGIFDAIQPDESSWNAWLARGLTPFAFGLLKAGGLDKDFLPCWYGDDLYVAVEHGEYVDAETVDRFLARYLSELAARFDIALKQSAYPEYLDEWPSVPLVGSKPLGQAYRDGDFRVHTVPTGPGSSELSTLWLRGNQVGDVASAIVAYTRVIEFVSATASRTDSHTRLRLLLGSEEAVSTPAGFLDRILSETEEFVRVNRADKELLRVAISAACVPTLLADRMAAIKPEIAKKLKSGNEAEKRAGMSEFAKILYATRNSLVHAKTNYKATGLEISENRLPEFAPVVRHAALMAMRWFYQQPEHTRVV